MLNSIPAIWYWTAINGMLPKVFSQLSILLNNYIPPSLCLEMHQKSTKPTSYRASQWQENYPEKPIAHCLLSYCWFSHLYKFVSSCFIGPHYFLKYVARLVVLPLDVFFMSLIISKNHLLCQIEAVWLIYNTTNHRPNIVIACYCLLLRDISCFLPCDAEWVPRD